MSSSRKVSNTSIPDFQEDQWILIQHKTFINWTNEQLVHNNRSVENLSSDLCDGVKLVALVEALQFRKIGKVYSKPANRIQMLYNVSLALQAVADEGVKLVNIGTDDIVGGNLKLILGLLWHLIIRYQISSSKTKAPPKKLMLMWFQTSVPGLNISNFTSNWSDGIALHALLDFCKPGLSPNWKKLSPNDRLQNCNQAMQLAKDHLGVPRVISAKDFCSSDLDELSAMTYLSYFIRKNSPGYNETLNWAIKQLKTTNITNLTTDWNDGYYLCSLVHSYNGDVKGWPNIDRKNHQATCQLGIDSARKLGIEPLLTAAELADPAVDHLSVMAYLCQFRRMTPKKDNADRLVLDCYLLGVKVGRTTTFKIIPSDKDCNQNKVTASVSGPSVTLDCSIKWENNVAVGSFQATEAGDHELHVRYDGAEIKGCPISFSVQYDEKTIQVTSNDSRCRLGQSHTIHIACPKKLCSLVEVRITSQSGQQKVLTTSETADGLQANFQPFSPGIWKYQIYIAGKEVNGSQVDVYDPAKAQLIGPQKGVAGDELIFSVNMRDSGGEKVTAEVSDGGDTRLDGVAVSSHGGTSYITFTPRVAGQHRVTAFLYGEPVDGSPRTIEVVDPGQITVSGEGLIRGIKGVEAYFTVDKKGLGGDISADIEVSGQRVACMREDRGTDEYEFSYVPGKVGTYTINIFWEDKPVAGSPFSASVTDRSRVSMLDDLRELKDDKDKIALEYGKPNKLNFDVSQAGPGTFKAEVLSPKGKLPVDVVQNSGRVTASFITLHEGDHYIHLYWSDAPADFSPLLAYCPGPPFPVDASKVVVTGKGAETARATVLAEFLIDGRLAGPGIPKVKLQGIQSELPVEIQSLKYDRYLCRYTSIIPGSFLLYIYWSDQMVPRCPFKVAVMTRGDVKKVKVSGDGLNGGISNTELKIFVDTREAGPGEVTAECHSHRYSARCDIKENSEGQYTLRIVPTEPEQHVLQIRYDGQHVPGSPFVLRVGEPPDPMKVRVYGSGIEHGLIDTFKSHFLVETAGAGAGQLAVKIRGPRGGFKVDMTRETKAERIINCRYDPTEPGEYIINVRWSGVDVPGSPFNVHIVESREELSTVSDLRGYLPDDLSMKWRAEV